MHRENRIREEKQHEREKMKNTLVVLIIIVMLSACAPDTRIKRGLGPRQSGQKEAVAAETSVSAEQQVDKIFYPMLPEQPRLQLLYSFTEKTVTEFKGGEKYFLQMKRAYDIGAAKGKIYVSDGAFKKVTVVDLETKSLSQINGDYESAGIWITDDDYKYIADFNKKQIVVFDSDNQLARVYAYRDQFDKPVDVAVFENKIYVCDLNQHKIIVIDKDSGKSIQEIGGPGKKEGSLYKPTHVVVDSEGNLYVNDFFNLRVQKFDRDGKFEKVFGYPGDTLGAFARPKGISTDRDGNLYVVDAAFENVQIFDEKTTELLLFFGGFGVTPGTMYLPNSVFVDYSNVDYFRNYADENFNLKYLVYVGNALGPIKVNVYGFGEWTGALSPGQENTEEK